MYNRLNLNEYFFIEYCNKWAGIRELIMHRDVTLVARKSSNKLKYLKLKERKLKTAKEVVIQF